MAGMGELARLVVRLVGDGTSYTKMLKKAKADTLASSSAIKTSGTAATASATAALNKYGKETLAAGADSKKLANDVSQTKAALKGQQQQLKAAGAALDNYGRSATKAGINVKKLGEDMKRVGMRMSLGITLPIVAAAGATVKMASDAEETSSKMLTTFSGVEDKASQAAADLAKNYNMSKTEAKDLLANTGDLLSGFEMVSNETLTLSTSINELAADLNSFQNLEGGVTRASTALTKALMGEREMAKMLGISFEEKDIVDQVALRTAKGLTHATEKQARAFAIVDLMYKRSPNAIGDVMRTQDSFANRFRELGNAVKDFGEVIGKDLLPVAKSLVNWGIDLLRTFEGMSAGVRRTIMVIAGLVALAGPVVFAFGLMFSAFAAYTAAATAAGYSAAGFTAMLWLKIKAMMVAAGWAVVLAIKMALIAGAVIAVAVVGWKLGKALRGMFGLTGIEDYNKEMEKSADLTHKLTQRQVKAHDAIIKQASLIENLVEKEKFLKKALEDSKKAEAGVTNQIKMQAAHVKSLSGWYNTLTGATLLSDARQELEGLETQLKSVKGRTGQLQKAFDATSGTTQSAADKVALLNMKAKDLNDEIKKEIQMFGKAGHEAKIFALQLEGIAEEKLKDVKASVARHKALGEDKTARDAAKTVIERLEKQRDTLGMTTAALLQYEMENDKAVPKEMKRAAAISATIEAMKEVAAIDAFNKKLEDQIETFGMTSTEAEIHRMELDKVAPAQIAAMRATDARLKGLNEELRLLDKGKQLIKQYMRPQEKFAKVKAELNKMFEQGNIDQHTYDSALKDAITVMQDAEKQANKDYEVDFSVAGIEGVEAGTAAAAARLQEFLALQNEEGGVGQVTGLQDKIQHTINATTSPLIPSSSPVTPVTPGAAIQPTVAGQDDHEGRVEKLLSRIATATEGSSVELTGAEL